MGKDVADEDVDPKYTHTKNNEPANRCQKCSEERVNKMPDAVLTVQRDDIDATIRHWRDRGVPADWIAIYLRREGLHVRGARWERLRPAMMAYARLREDAPMRVAT